MNTYTNTDTSRTSCSIIKSYCKFNGFMCEYANENGYCRLTACAYPDVVYRGTTIVKTRILKESEADGMTKEEAIEMLEDLDGAVEDNHGRDYDEAFRMAIKALKADTVSREEAIQAIDKCRERKNKVIEQLREFYSQKPTIPTFAESAEAYKAWTGEEMGKTSDEINEMNREIIKDILKTMPTAYLLEALGVATVDELMKPADAVQGEWIMVKGSNGKDYHKCSKCFHTQEITGVKNYCAVCGARMKGGAE